MLIYRHVKGLDPVSGAEGLPLLLPITIMSRPNIPLLVRQSGPPARPLSASSRGSPRNTSKSRAYVLGIVTIHGTLEFLLLR